VFTATFSPRQSRDDFFAAPGVPKEFNLDRPSQFFDTTFMAS
jgi:hypothetical protein